MTWRFRGDDMFSMNGARLRAQTRLHGEARSFQPLRISSAWLASRASIRGPDRRISPACPSSCGCARLREYCRPCRSPAWRSLPGAPAGPRSRSRGKYAALARQLAQHNVGEQPHVDIAAESTTPIFRPRNNSGLPSTAASDAAPAPSTTVFSISRSRTRALSISSSRTSNTSLTSASTTRFANGPGRFTAIPSAIVCPRTAIARPSPRRT